MKDESQMKLVDIETLDQVPEVIGMKIDIDPDAGTSVVEITRRDGMVIRQKAAAFQKREIQDVIMQALNILSRPID
jgi:hypothetical protein